MAESIRVDGAPDTVPPGPKPARRTLRFHTIDDAISEAMRLADAHRLGKLERAGNWELGQALGHLAAFANFPFDGYPDSLQAPLPVRMVLRLLRNRILRRGMPPGVRIGRVLGGTVAVDVLPAEEGLRRFGEAMRRLRQTSPTITNPVFGKLTHDQWIQLNLRHAELHLGFHVPVER